MDTSRRGLIYNDGTSYSHLTKKYLAKRKICYDETTCRFLDVMPKLICEHIKSDGGLRRVAKMAGIDYLSARNYYTGRTVPLLENFMKLANFLRYDISASLNAQIYNGEFSMYEFRQRIARLKLSTSAIAQRTGFSVSDVRGILGYTKYRDNFNLNCLDSMLTLVERMEIDLEDAGNN